MSEDNAHTPSKLYETLQFKERGGKTFEVPVQGCLGLLALGDLGLVAWREKKVEYIQELQNRASKQDASK